MALFVDHARRHIRASAQWLNLTLENPGETQARILYDLGTFKALNQDQKGSKSLDRLVSVTKADPALLGTFIPLPTSRR